MNQGGTRPLHEPTTNAWTDQKPTSTKTWTNPWTQHMNPAQKQELAMSINKNYPSIKLLFKNQKKAWLCP